MHFSTYGESLRMIDVFPQSLVASRGALAQRDAPRLTCRTDQFGQAESRPPKKERFGISLTDSPPVENRVDQRKRPRIAETCITPAANAVNGLLGDCRFTR